MFLNLLLAINEEALSKSLDILWKGLLAMVVVIGVIMIITYIMQHVSYKAQIKKEKQQQQEQNQTQPPTDNNAAN